MYVRQPILEEAPGRYVELSAGEAGVDDTVSILRRMVDQDRLDPAVKAAAVEIAGNVRPTDTLGYIKAVWKGVRDRMTYVPDTWRIEEVTSPAIHSRRIVGGGKSWGDCDDFAVLGAAWLGALGVPARFRVLASPKNGGKFDHIRVEAKGPAGWIPLETTMRRVSFGRAVPDLRSKLYEV